MFGFEGLGLLIMDYWIWFKVDSWDWELCGRGLGWVVIVGFGEVVGNGELFVLELLYLYWLCCFFEWWVFVLCWLVGCFGMMGVFGYFVFELGN